MTQVLRRQIIAYLYYLLTAQPNKLTKMMFDNNYDEKTKIEFCHELENQYKELVIKR